MEVKTAKTAGFCYGVQRAVDMLEEELGKSTPALYTYGPLVHNETVVGSFRERGVGVIGGKEELKALGEEGKLRGASVVIRAHGVGREERELLAAAGARVIDATCPFVKRIHDLVTEHHTESEEILITGDPRHPEVLGILGEIGNDAKVLESAEEAASFEPEKGKKAFLVSQTTFHEQKFEDIVAILKKKVYDICVVKTICNATQLRQKEAAALSRECDAMIVIGSRSSSNTAKLAEICSSLCRATYYVQSSDELPGSVSFNSSVRCVGITAGASTPKSIIEEVSGYVRNEL